MSCIGDFDASNSTRIGELSSYVFQEQATESFIYLPGKGTHAFKLSQRYCLCHIGTGDIVRDEVAHGTVFGKKVKDILSQGGLEDDDLMIDLIASNLEKYSITILSIYIFRL